MNREKMAQTLLDCFPITLPKAKKGEDYSSTFSLPENLIPQAIEGLEALGLQWAASHWAADYWTISGAPLTAGDHEIFLRCSYPGWRAGMPLLKRSLRLIVTPAQATPLVEPEIAAAMRQVREIMSEEMLRDERRVAAFLADLLGNRYPGERRLLKELVTIGIPRMIANGQVTAADLPAKANFVAQTYLWNEAAALAAIRLWYETLRQEETQQQQELPNTIHKSTDIGQQLYSAAFKGDTNALAMLYKMAEQGHADAQCKLGTIYEDGKFLQKDKHSAFELYKKAAEQGHAIAQFFLGQLYEHGNIIQKDERKAFEWYSKSAEQGFEFAQDALNYLNRQSRVVQELKIKCLRISAEKGNNKDFSTLRQKAEQGNHYAQFHLAEIYRNGTVLWLGRNENIAANWYRAAAEQGHIDAKNALETAARQGSATAQFYLGWIYENGLSVPKDSQQALEWYRKAAEQGYANAKEALRRLGIQLSQPAPSPIDLYPAAAQGNAVALKALQHMAEQGNADAQYNLGWMYAKGEGVPKDTRQAAELYRKAAHQGHRGAQNLLHRLET